MELLQEFGFDLEYVKGKENVVADALTRRPLTNAISYMGNSLIDEIKMHYANDDFFKFPLRACLRKLGPLMRLKNFNLLI